MRKKRSPSLADANRTPYGLRLHLSRRRSGLTQDQLADAANVGQTTVTDAERIAQGSKHTPVFARILKVDAEWLATGDLALAPGWWFDLGQAVTSKTEHATVPVHDSAIPAGSGGHHPVMLPVIYGRWLGMISIKNDDPRIADLDRVEARSTGLSDSAKAYRMPDDSLGPRIQKGDIVEFDPVFDEDSLTGDSIVMVRTEEGRHFPRRFDPIEITANRLTLVAKARGVYFPLD